MRARRDALTVSAPPSQAADVPSHPAMVLARCLPRGRNAMPQPNAPADHDVERSISNGPNARPRDEPIGQTEHGLPDDSSKPVDISPEEEAQIADKILNR